MKCHLANDVERGGRPQEALSLIELIGVLAVLAAGAGLLVPATIRHLDRVASEQELTRLQALGDALEQSILRTRYIPAHTNWATVVAAQTGMNLGAVIANARNHPRILLVDAGGWLSTNLPYTQGYLGTPVLPTNARMMLVSSLGRDLPVTSGMPSAAEFADLWNAPPGTVPWTGWSGDPDDVKIHRLSLSPLFVRLVLTTYNSSTNGQYAVDASATNQVPWNNGIGGCFLKNTVLRLYGGLPTSTLDSTQILNDDTSFVYEGGMWKRAIQGRLSTGVGDVAGIVAAFLAATPNTNAQNKFTNAQQILVVQTMTDYISNYNVWAEGDFTSEPLRLHLVDIQSAMMDAVQGLYGNIGGTQYYPTNGTPCL